jgi:hypothetical protein
MDSEATINAAIILRATFRLNDTTGVGNEFMGLQEDHETEL